MNNPRLRLRAVFMAPTRSIHYVSTLRRLSDRAGPRVPRVAMPKTGRQPGTYRRMLRRNIDRSNRVPVRLDMSCDHPKTSHALLLSVVQYQVTSHL